MIVLTRKVGNKRKRQEPQRIVIDLRNVDLSQLSPTQRILQVEVLGASASDCRVGVRAHRSIPVHRAEVFDDIEQTGRKAPDGSPPDSPEPDKEAA